MLSDTDIKELERTFFLSSLLCGKQDISREFPRALDIGSHAGHIFQAICEKVQLTNLVPCMKFTTTHKNQSFTCKVRNTCSEGIFHRAKLEGNGFRDVRAFMYTLIKLSKTWTK